MNMSTVCPRSSVRLAAVCLLLGFLGGCATAKNPTDPLEPFNRGVYEFNETVDKYVLKPVAQGYQFVLPQPVRMYVGNFFSNINDVTVLANNVLQGKFINALDDFARIVINTTLGLLGFLDIASEAGIAKQNEDFGQTLGVWGVADGPFIMLPFFGPSTARDTVGRVGDYFTDVVTYVDPTGTRNIYRGTRIVDTRAQLLDASKVFDAAALDPYEFLRDAYLQRRRNLIYDGKPPADRDLDLVPPARDKKVDSDVPERPLAAAPALERSTGASENSITASEDHVAPVIVRAQEIVPLFLDSPEEARAVANARSERAARVAGVASGSGVSAERGESATPEKAPASSADGATSGSSRVMRLWRYMWDAPAQAPEGSGS
jgi:phospholipid-binding lipoprotein MlaA